MLWGNGGAKKKKKIRLLEFLVCVTFTLPYFSEFPSCAFLS